ncbi:hypothetical protein DL95DRAFT_387011 [Leptodontidium sp. 2 PMI_412]|nr:hypothetical protein DL95DRAFT_387011 [Leptodontidium sp. 2 PMI_412]
MCNAVNDRFIGRPAPSQSLVQSASAFVCFGVAVASLTCTTNSPTPDRHRSTSPNHHPSPRTHVPQLYSAQQMIPVPT